MTVAFGDIPAATFLELGKGLTADAGKHIDPVASRKLKQDSYVDDHITGGSKEEVKRMMGVKQEDGSYSGTFGEILKKGKLLVKVMVPSGETDKEAMDMLGNKVLAYYWDATSDQMAVMLPINTSGRVRKIKLKPELFLVS